MVPPSCPKPCHKNLFTNVAISLHSFSYPKPYKLAAQSYFLCPFIPLNFDYCKCNLQLLLSFLPTLLSLNLHPTLYPNASKPSIMDAEPQPLIQTCPESLRQAFAATFSVKMINSILDAVLRCYPEADGASFLVDYCRFFHAYADSATHLDVIFLEDVREFLQKLSAQNLDPISHAKKVKNAVKAWDRQIKKLKLTEPKPSVQDEAQAQERGFFESIFGVFMGSDSYEEEDYSPLPVPKHHIQALYTWNSYQRQQIVSLEASIASLPQNKQLRNDFNPMLEARTAELQSLKNHVKNLQDSCHERDKDRTALEEALKDMEAEKKEIQSAKNTEIQKLRQQIAAQDKDNESLRECQRAQNAGHQGKQRLEA
ncbi:hypothetical protein L596_021842 [Steinernema carpocapsae]|uniref:Uncharacterized protein n=1 Tax=Steinernema carpocapsae TaxID=34508 RepID=A0A4U5MK02_STECR|nr:hypothetical protein L596_021842 [Steinernema carpocapsae]